MEAIVYKPILVRSGRNPEKMAYYLRGYNKIVPCMWDDHPKRDHPPPGFVFVNVNGKDAQEKVVRIRLPVHIAYMLVKAPWFKRFVPLEHLGDMHGWSERFKEHSRWMQAEYDRCVEESKQHDDAA